jgi:hypothetical protein
MLGGIVKGAVGICGFSFSAQHQAASGMDIDVAREKAARPAEGDVRFQRVIEILIGNQIELLGDTCAECVREIDLFA